MVLSVPEPSALAGDLTVIVPAFNEAASVADTVHSILKQTCPPRVVIVVDDFSSDGTGDIAREAGATVIRPPKNTGSKAGAQNYALGHVTTTFAMAIDADTVLAPDAVEKLLPAVADERTAAACGFVVPRYVRTPWERGRYVEYLFAFTFYKPVQDYFGRPLISSGCFSVYRTEALRAHGGWGTRTLAEDMDLTWTFHAAGLGVRFVPEAVCYPIEPESFHFMRKQLRRWSHGFIQNVLLHWPNVVRLPYLRSMVGVALWDAMVASFAYLFLIPALAIALKSPLLLLAYVIDVPAVLVPALATAARRKEVPQALASIPGFIILRFVNAFFLLEALWSNVVVKRPLLTYEKGH
jgi:poly-beta-1,6-N-acetyl-D-glucosamine synthase